VLTALPFVAAAQPRAAPTATAADPATTAVPADKLIEKYTPLAGSEQNAKSLVSGLRDGTQITLSSPSGTTSFDPPTGKMGYGNVNIVLALAERQLSSTANPTPAQLQSALTNSENGVLTLRAKGMGWGEIAQVYGYKLGDVMKASAAKDSPSAARKEESGSSQQAARESRGNAARPDVERFDHRPQKVERPERPQRPERSGR
jgi:hypothetical protein